MRKLKILKKRKMKDIVYNMKKNIRPLSFSPIIETRSRYPFQQQFQKKSSKGNCEHHQLDRFIPPNRSAMDFDYAHYLCLLRGTKVRKIQ
ncbi:hypothetical protein glysoja_024117 [Glycine soja]|uniref:Uncharacterized protein n=1 Tax=Glycine soja TaxID=3848 RepID=A0A0B2RLC7_GLYSO|nr:hypothetical protein glysoja_024117 [Glycine soja]